MCEKQSCDPIGNCVETFKSLVVNDNIHGNLEVPRICKAIIDTLEFGRLKYINQLGTSYLVYPGATHNRWEHSVGVMKIAGQFVHHLMGKYPGCCTEKDRLAVMLAGLCHDLGHGPFSHLWEFFVHKARPGCGWTHEQASLKMFDYLIEKNNLMPLFEEEGFDANDILFIKEMMYGPLPENGGEYVARGPEKYFLYEIVANKTTSIDVDKWDYFKRDSQALDVNIIFDYERYILMSYLQWDENKRRRLALAEKEASSVVNLFKDRANLHAMGYQHRVVKVFDQMVVDMLCLADKHIHLCYDEQDKPVSLSEACDNMYAYSQLTDNHLLMSIQNSRSQEFSEARDICRRIACRDQYKCIGSICIDEGKSSLAKKLDDIEKSWIEFVSANGKTLSPSDFPLTLKRITYGCSSNPMERVFLVNSKGERISPDKKHIKELENVCDEELFFLLRPSGHQAHLEGIQLFTTWNPKLEGLQILKHIRN